MPKIAYAQWPWGTKTREQFIESCKDLSELGYHYFESVRTFIDTFKNDLADFKAITNEYDLRPISFYFHLTGNPEADLRELESKIDFVAANDIKTITLQALWTREARTPEDLRTALGTVNDYALVCKQYGILPCVHPHTNTTIMYENEIDFIMQNTDPELVGFAPDTAHLLAASCDPVEICERYQDRIAFTHIKDVSGPAESVGMQDGVEVYSNFLELGTGNVDFDGVFQVYKRCGYDGFLCLELDVPPVSNRQSAQRNLEFIKKHWVW